MNNVVIRAEGIGKRYRIGGSKRHYDRFGEQFVDSVKKPFRRSAENLNESEFWALKNVSFEINQGEIVGIIGLNGAGKSTLLKILSRITEPTEGYADICGRVSSLLEVGTGFHPELTGRENIYLNGAILGMRKEEIRRKFDAIVDFSEVKRFLDTPIKRFSSGMYVRLAFAVAAYLEPEILLVDEVLAVGDLAFQKKCLGKMSSVSRQGRTIIFVSHNMNAVRNLCSKSILLSQGKLISIGDTPSIIEQYLNSTTGASVPGDWNNLRSVYREGTGGVRFEAILYRGHDKSLGFKPFSGGSVEFSLKLSSDFRRTVDSIAVTLYDRYGTKLVNADTLTLGNSITLSSGRNLIRIRINKLYLNPGVYTLGLWVANPPKEVYDFISSALLFEVVEKDADQFRVDGDGAVPCVFQLLDVTELDEDLESSANSIAT